MPAFVDTNVFIHFLLGFDQARASRCHALLKAAEDGAAQLETSTMVLAELVWFLSRPPVKLDPRGVRQRLSPLIELRGLHVPDRAVLRQALDTYAETGIGFIDAYNAAVMRKRRLDRTYSYDTDFDRVTGITRVEP